MLSQFNDSMNGIDKIAGKIAEDAKNEADSILAGARAEAGAIADKYAALAKEEADKVLLTGQKRAVEISRRIASTADQEAKLQILTTKQYMISQVFDQAMQKLLTLPEEEYVNLLARLAAGASSDGSEEIIFSSKDLNAFGSRVLESANQLLAEAGKKSNLTLSAETGNFDGGLLLRSGKVETNCTLDAILRLSKEDLASEVTAVLFH